MNKTSVGDKFKIYLISTITVTLFGEMYFFPFQDPFRFSLGVIAFSIILLFYDDIKELYLGIFTGISVLVLRSLLYYFEGNLSLIELIKINLPSAIYYIVYAITFYMIRIRKYREFPGNTIYYLSMADVGIVSDAGTRNLIELINIVGDVKRREDSSSYNLQKLYKEMAYKEGVNPNTIEQRIRRAVQKSLVTTAEFGIDDYYNPKFTEYSTLLFEFTQVKQEMNYIKGQTRRRGKVNIRKFVEGILSKLY